MRGDSAKASPARTGSSGVPIPSAPHSLTMPRNATHEQQRPPQPLGRPTAGNCSDVRRASEERTHREQVAVRLVLHLAERTDRVPQVRARSRKPHRVDRRGRAWCRPRCGPAACDEGERDEQRGSTHAAAGADAAGSLRRRPASLTSSSARSRGSTSPARAARHAQDPPRPARQVARDHGDHLGRRLPARPAQPGGGRDREERRAEDVLGRVPVLASRSAGPRGGRRGSATATVSCPPHGPYQSV